VAFGDEREKMYVTYDPALVSPSISVFADVHRDIPRKTTAVDFEVINPSEKFDITFVISTKGNMI
jgi:hypothetical protein